MAVTVSSIEELQKVMMQQVHEAMEKSSDELINEIQKSMDEVVYSYKPSYYSRTYSLKKTLESDYKKSYWNHLKASILIHHNKFGDNAEWTSVKSGNHYRNVPETVTQGKYGTFYGVGADEEYHNINPNTRNALLTWSKPRDYMKHAEEKLGGDGYLKRCLKPHLPSHITIK